MRSSATHSPLSGAAAHSDLCRACTAARADQCRIAHSTPSVPHRSAALQLLEYAAYLANAFGLDPSDRTLLRAYMTSASACVITNGCDAMQSLAAVLRSPSLQRVVLHTCDGPMPMAYSRHTAVAALMTREYSRSSGGRMGRRHHGQRSELAFRPAQPIAAEHARSRPGIPLTNGAGIPLNATIVLLLIDRSFGWFERIAALAAAVVWRQHVRCGR